MIRRGGGCLPLQRGRIVPARRITRRKGLVVVATAPHDHRIVRGPMGEMYGQGTTTTTTMTRMTMTTLRRAFSSDPPPPSTPTRIVGSSHPSSPIEDASTTTTTTTTPTSTPMSLWEQFQTPPNIITVTRMASTPLLAYWVITEQHWWALGGCTLAALSDYLDGYLAKTYGWKTVLGTYLDPLADKALVNTLGLGLWYTGVLPTPLILLWVTKDVMLLSGTAWTLYQKHGTMSILTNSVSQQPLTVTPSTIAKINTTLQFTTLLVGLGSPVLLPLLLGMESGGGGIMMMMMTMDHSPLLWEGLLWTTGGTTVGTVLWYATRSGMGRFHSIR